MTNPRYSFVLLTAAAALGGCAALPPSAANVDAGFGSAVRLAIAAQTLNPDAGKRARGPEGFDGQSAVSAVVRHRGTFKEPPPSFSIVGIGAVQ